MTTSTAVKSEADFDDDRNAASAAAPVVASATPSSAVPSRGLLRPHQLCLFRRQESQHPKQPQKKRPHRWPLWPNLESRQPNLQGLRQQPNLLGVKPVAEVAAAATPATAKPAVDATVPPVAAAKDAGAATKKAVAASATSGLPLARKPPEPTLDAKDDDDDNADSSSASSSDDQSDRTKKIEKSQEAPSAAKKKESKFGACSGGGHAG